jgi:hypothetical protein
MNFGGGQDLAWEACDTIDDDHEDQNSELSKYFEDKTDELALRIVSIFRPRRGQ